MRVGVLGLALVVVAACQPAADSTNYAGGTASQPIVGGTPDASDAAVVLVLAFQSTGNMVVICTGEIVSPHVVLTAAHCVDPSSVGPNAKFVVFLGSDVHDQAQASDPSLALSVQRTAFDPQWNPAAPRSGHDVGVVILTDPAPRTPVVMNRTPLDSSFDGAPIRLVGFGITDSGDDAGTTAATRRQVTTSKTSIDSEFISVDDPTHDICNGDSGGAGFMTVDGVEVLAGTTSFGDPACRVFGDLDRVDVFGAPFADPFIRQYDGAPPVGCPAASASVCVSSTVVGHCAGGVVTSTQDCAPSGATCGSQNGSATCVSPAAQAVSVPNPGGGCENAEASALAVAALLVLAARPRRA